MTSNIRNKHSGHVVSRQDLIPDGALEDLQDDKFDHSVIAQRIAELSISADAPVNIALFGAWGSGKSSVYAMVKHHIGRIDSKVPIVRYDAWKYGGHDLKRNFVASIAEELGCNEREFNHGLHSEPFRARHHVR